MSPLSHRDRRPWSDVRRRRPTDECSASRPSAREAALCTYRAQRRLKHTEAGGLATHMLGPAQRVRPSVSPSSFHGRRCRRSSHCVETRLRVVRCCIRRDRSLIGANDSVVATSIVARLGVPYISRERKLFNGRRRMCVALSIICRRLMLSAVCS